MLNKSNKTYISAFQDIYTNIKSIQKTLNSKKKMIYYSMIKLSKILNGKSATIARTTKTFYIIVWLYKWAYLHGKQIGFLHIKV